VHLERGDEHHILVEEYTDYVRNLDNQTGDLRQLDHEWMIRCELDVTHLANLWLDASNTPVVRHRIHCFHLGN
jgi:hypothetical protein